MSDERSLLAHLVPRLTRGVEDAVTDALAFILNVSEPCRDALVAMVSADGPKVEPVVHVKTQLTVSDKGRLDLVAFDDAGSKRLIIESKFWAPLLDGQASGYVKHLADDGPAMLLFVAPEARHETLWAKIEQQFEHPSGRLKLGSARNDGKIRVVDVVDTAKRVALMSWNDLLDGLEHVDPQMDANLQQLRGLAQSQDEIALAPLHAEDLNAVIPRRIMGFNQLVDGVVRRAAQKGWMTTKGLRAAPQRNGFLRFFRFVNRDRVSTDLALCVSYEQWARSGETPLWLRIWPDRKDEINAVRRASAEPVGWRPGDTMWIPIQLKTGAEHADVLEDVVAQVKRVRDIVLP